MTFGRRKLESQGELKTIQSLMHYATVTSLWSRHKLKTNRMNPHMPCFVLVVNSSKWLIQLCT